MNDLIYILSGIFIFLSFQLVIKTVKRHKKQPVNIWEEPIPPQNQNWQGKIPTIQPQVAPPPHMFRQN
ncbi:MAG: hypothetical protein CMB48_05605 [Euryarchaeota archaeon]|nr:hypothetical protein [Euryarchaeota archaeon]